MSDCSLRVIVLPSLVYPYSKLDIEQDEIGKSLFVNRGRKLNEWKDFAAFAIPTEPSGVILIGGVN